MSTKMKRFNPLVGVLAIAALMAPTIVNAQGTVRGYFDFFDNMCYPCTGPMETNEFCTCQAKVQDSMQAAVRR